MTGPGPTIQLDADGPANTNLANAAETVVATLTGVTTRSASTQVILEGSAQITTGASTTSVTLRIRRGGLAGAQVGQPAQQNCGAAVPVAASIQVDDFPGETVSATYVLTATQNAATGAGTAVSANLTATH